MYTFISFYIFHSFVYNAQAISRNMSNQCFLNLSNTLAVNLNLTNDSYLM